jgi:hypothetical protein
MDLFEIGECREVKFLDKPVKQARVEIDGKEIIWDIPAEVEHSLTGAKELKGVTAEVTRLENSYETRFINHLPHWKVENFITFQREAGIRE